MGLDANWTADDVVNCRDVRRLTDIIRRHGEERLVYACNAIGCRPIETTNQLAEVVVAAIPAPANGGHPAKRTFHTHQPSRTRALSTVIDVAIDCGFQVVSGAVVSGGNRIKQRMMHMQRTAGSVRQSFLRVRVLIVRIVRVAKKLSAAEIERNRRSTSARLRVADELGGVPMAIARVDQYAGTEPPASPEARNSPNHPCRCLHCNADCPVS